MSLESVNLLRDSFFTKRVLNVIKEKGSMDESRREIFERILKYLDTIKNGKEQIQTGNLVEQPVKSIIAYRKAIGIIADLPCDEEKNEKYFNKILEDIEKEVKGTLRTNIVSPESLKTTVEYFKEARKIAVMESARETMGGQEVVTWQTPMQF